MDTLQEAIFKAMLNHDWFTDSDGNVDSPTGYFGYVVNSVADWEEVADTFEDTISAYAGDEYNSTWILEHFAGVYSAYIDSNGIIHIYKHGDYVRTPGVACMGIEITPVVAEAQKWFRDATESYNEWDAN